MTRHAVVWVILACIHRCTWHLLGHVSRHPATRTTHIHTRVHAVVLHPRERTVLFDVRHAMAVQFIPHHGSSVTYMSEYSLHSSVAHLYYKPDAHDRAPGGSRLLGAPGANRNLPRWCTMGCKIPKKAKGQSSLNQATDWETSASHRALEFQRPLNLVYSLSRLVARKWNTDASLQGAHAMGTRSNPAESGRYNRLVRGSRIRLNSKLTVTTYRRHGGGDQGQAKTRKQSSAKQAHIN